MEELLNLLREIFPDIIAGLILAFILASLAIGYRTILNWFGQLFSIFIRSRKRVITKKERNLFSLYLREEKRNILTAIAPGSISMQVSEIIEGDSGLFIKPPWGDYQGIYQNNEIIEYLKESIINGRRVILLGEPGQGKTTLLKRLFIILVNNFIESKSDLLAFYLPIRDFEFSSNKNGIVSEVWEHLNKPNNPLPFSYERFILLLNTSNIVFLFDGFDEMKGELQPRLINERASQVIFFKNSILSCRTNFYELYLSASVLQEKYAEKVKLLPLEFNDLLRTHINEFCLRKGWSGSEEILNAIQKSRELLDLTKRPLLLMMMLDIFTDLPQLLKIEWTLAKLYDKYTQKWLKNESAKPDSILKWYEKNYLIEEIAWSVYSRKAFSNYAYGDISNQSVTFTISEVRDSLTPEITNRVQAVSLNYIVDDICHRTFLIVSTGERLYFIHKSFQEFYVAKHIYKNLQYNSRATAQVLQVLIPMEVATFLKDMLNAKDLDKHERDIIVKNLINAYKQNKGLKQDRLVVRQHASYYLACLKTQEAVKFLQQAYRSETNKWVQRGMMIGLALFCDRSDILEEYINMLYKDSEATSINIGYHLVYYGDQSLEEGYYDKGGSKCDGTIRTIFRHLMSNDDHKAGWALDLHTLRTLLMDKNRGISILYNDKSYISNLSEFLSREHREQGSSFHKEKELLEVFLKKEGVL